ncbi:MAG: hypothetical protein WD578_07610, partial [Bacteroidales bacterium]
YLEWVDHYGRVHRKRLFINHGGSLNRDVSDGAGFHRMSLLFKPQRTESKLLSKWIQDNFKLL